MEFQIFKEMYFGLNINKVYIALIIMFFFKYIVYSNN